MKKPLSHEEFVQIARSSPPDGRSPFAFEKRVMAHLRSAPEPDSLALWTRALWRAVAPCLGVMLLAAAFSVSLPATEPPSVADSADAPDLLETTVFAPTEIDFDLGA